MSATPGSATELAFTCFMAFIAFEVAVFIVFIEAAGFFMTFFGGASAFAVIFAALSFLFAAFTVFFAIVMRLVRGLLQDWTGT